MQGFVKKFIIYFLSAGMFFSGGIFLWAATLHVPDLKTFNERKITQSTKIYDRTGEILLYDIHKDVQRTVIPLEEIAYHMKNATVAIEDAEFYEHRGIKPTAILRAVLINIGALGFEQGGSTITQQVVKNSLLTPQKSIARKLKEWILALKLERIANKQEILELYLNEVPYGGNLYGIEEASNAFFGKSASELTLAESAYLAALPQAPTYYSPYGNNLSELEKRKNLVLSRMRELNFIDEETYTKVMEERVEFQPRATFGTRAPHFVFFIQEYLEKKYGKEIIERGGLRIITTLDANLQEKAEKIISQFAETNAENFNAHNAGLIAIDPTTGEILVMVGSRDYFSESYPEGCNPGIDCLFDPQVNVTITKRQPGSAFKPFVYATAFTKGYTPETVVFDLETQFHTGCSPDGEPLYSSVNEDDCYTPTNYDDVFRGPVTFRNALAQSINIPAIKVLYLAGLRDSLETAKNMGITSLTDINRYGLTLVLGGGEVSLLDITSSYGVFANNGLRNNYTGILEIKDSKGNILESLQKKQERVLEEEIALKISNILSDNEARTPAFGAHSPLYFPGRDVAAKTGTTNDYRDAWIIGYTPNIVVGAWAGNNNNESMEKRVAGFTIAPLWNAFMQEALAIIPPTSFKKPSEYSKEDLKPILRGEWIGGESYFIDTISGKRATEYTPDETKQERFIPDVHSILYWADKNNPLGPKLEDPSKDPQFYLWEEQVKKWVEKQNIKKDESAPLEYDSVHKPEYFPVVLVKSFDENLVYTPDQLVRLEVDGVSNFGLQKVDLFINNRYISSVKTKPFIFSFIPNDIDGIKNKNEIKLVAYDTVFNKGEKILNFQVNPHTSFKVEAGVGVN